MQSYARTNEIPPEYQGTAPALTQLYRVRTAQCLTIADLTKPVRNLLDEGWRVINGLELTDPG
jgi:hypothetical protein